MQNKPEPLYFLNDNIGFAQLINIAGSDLDIVNAAKASFDNQASEVGEKEVKLLKYLADHKHLSPFEHNLFSFRLKIPLYVIQQLLRHRISSFNQESFRYVEIKNEFYVPTQFRSQSKNNKQGSGDNLDYLDNIHAHQTYAVAVQQAKTMYDQLIGFGVAREIARGVLPTCTYSTIIYTTNFRSLLNFLQLRLASDAQFEIRKLAESILRLVREEGSFKHTLRVFDL
jgi:thymidylate synthase (FAD)